MNHSSSKKTVSFNSPEDQDGVPSQDVHQVDDNELARNMRANKATDQEIEEFKKLKKYASNHRLRHVYRQYNEFKYEISKIIDDYKDE